jgi:hypothetical protein
LHETISGACIRYFEEEGHMSVYRNFICDFPNRCDRILSDYERLATFRGLEVTAMLAIASAGLILPYETSV